MRFRRFGLAEGANLPGDPWFRACLAGIKLSVVGGPLSFVGKAIANTLSFSLPPSIGR